MVLSSDYMHPHRRWHALKGCWVLVSPHRTARPWSGALEKDSGQERPTYDPGCYLCPGNERKNGDKNPCYEDVFVFENDFPALYVRKDQKENKASEDAPPFIKMTSEEGLCRVICFSPRHDLTLPEMPVAAIRKVIDVWGGQYQELIANPAISHVMVFENKGDIMGCSNPHPHGQIWASKFIPDIPSTAINAQSTYHKTHGSLLLQDYLEWEIKEGLRIVCENEAWVALVPFWAEWPFETMILPRRDVRSIAELQPPERDAWAAIMKELLTRYDNLFETSFPYSMGVYQAPKGWQENKAISLYQIFLPPLLRSATIKKFMVGFELTAEVQRDITAETAAERLRACSTRHYKTRDVCAE